MSLSNIEEKILYSLENDLFEFKTPLYKLNVPLFSNVYVKDESKNKTGTHKDRLAYVILNIYKSFLKTKKESNKEYDLPSMSLLSSGAAAIAVQTVLKKYKLPNLKVLLDENTDIKIINNLNGLGCEIYKCKFTDKVLSGQDILNFTNNLDGIDITSCSAFEPSKNFYNSLVEELSNSNFDYIFMPYGSGNLYDSFLNYSKNKDIDWLKKCNFIGGTVDNHLSLANQLYSPYRPFSNYNKQWINMFKLQGYCGFESNIYSVEENNLLGAINLFKLNNVDASPEGCVGLALLSQLKDKIPFDKKILVINTGKIKTNFNQI
jgi:hypothetical protein